MVFGVKCKFVFRYEVDISTPSQPEYHYRGERRGGSHRTGKTELLSTPLLRVLHNR